LRESQGLTRRRYPEWCSAGRVVVKPIHPIAEYKARWSRQPGARNAPAPQPVHVACIFCLFLEVFAMKLAVAFTMLGLLSVFGAGCSSSDDEEAKTGPVSASPLTGAIEGKAFEAKSAIAKKGFDDGERSINIFDKAVTCADFDSDADRYILLSVPWKAASRDFKISLGSDDSQTATFVIKRASETDNIVSTQGRIEILEAPTEAGQKGKIRLRATAQGNNVEGEIAVEVCE
jgi:hypothetical protein